ncbi:MAG: thermonuclease family protein [Pseudomonadota bacterium]
MNCFRLALSVFCLVFAPSIGASAHATERLAGPFPASLLRVIDGDTVAVSLTVWVGQTVKTRIRLLGIDAPSLTGACETERRLAHEAKTFVEAALVGQAFFVRDVKVGKYGGRYLAVIETSTGTELSTALLAAGLARPYDGGRKSDWCSDRVSKAQK